MSKWNNGKEPNTIWGLNRRKLFGCWLCWVYVIVVRFIVSFIDLHLSCWVLRKLSFLKENYGFNSNDLFRVKIFTMNVLWISIDFSTIVSTLNYAIFIYSKITPKISLKCWPWSMWKSLQHYCYSACLTQHADMK
jgi:hypothetical protein